MADVTKACDRYFPIVFTDLDGTLLDHDSYSYEPALPALTKLKQAGIPVVLASSKTRAEMIPIHDELGLEAPFIYENGGGVGWPESWQDTVQFDDDTAHYANIREMLDTLPHNIRQRFSGFGDWSLDRLVAETGLTRGEAEQAAQREFSEPGLWSGTPGQFDEFARHVKAAGFCVVKGGRFHTVCGPQTKASRLGQIRAHYVSRHAAQRTVYAIALGDAPNDIAMLQASDRGFIIFNNHCSDIQVLPEEASGKITRSQLAGPAGWNECIVAAFTELADDGIADAPGSVTHGNETRTTGNTNNG